MVVKLPSHSAMAQERLKPWLWDGAAGLAKELLALAALAQNDARECCQLAEAGNAQALAQIGVLGARVLTLERELIEGMEIMKVSVKYGLGDPCACGVQTRTLTPSSLILPEQEAEADARASRHEAARERERASALEEHVRSYREREDDYFKRYREHEEEFAQRAKDMRECEKECERKLLAAENLFSYCTKNGYTSAVPNLLGLAAPLTHSRAEGATQDARAFMTPSGAHCLGADSEDLRGKEEKSQRRDSQAVGGERGEEEEDQMREGDRSESATLQSLFTVPLSSTCTPAAAPSTPLSCLPSPYASLTPADLVSHWQQVQRHVLERESLLEQLEAEVGQREDEKMQLINDVAQKSIELLESKSRVSALQDEIAGLQQQRKELEADRAKQAYGVEEARKLAAQELYMEREKLIEAWEGEMRAERAQRERALEEERANWNQRMLRENEAWEQNLREQRDERERKLHEQWALRRDEEERKIEERARERADLERAVVELKVELERIQDNGRRERGLMIVHEREKMKDIAALEESVSRMKVEEDEVREIIKRQCARASELEAVLMLRESERVRDLRALVDEVSRLKAEKEALESWVDLRRREEEAIQQGRTREAEEERRLMALERQEQERVRGVLETEIDVLIAQEQVLREKVESRLKGEEERMRERMKQRLKVEEASLRESAGLRVSEDGDGLRANKRLQMTVEAKAGDGMRESEADSQRREINQLVDKREFREMIMELQRHSEKSEQGQQEMERGMSEGSMDRVYTRSSYMTLGDLALGSEGDVRMESCGGRGVRGAVKSLKMLSEKWKLEKRKSADKRESGEKENDGNAMEAGSEARRESEAQNVTNKKMAVEEREGENEERQRGQEGGGGDEEALDERREHAKVEAPAGQKAREMTGDERRSRGEERRQRPSAVKSENGKRERKRAQNKNKKVEKGEQGHGAKGERGETEERKEEEEEASNCTISSAKGECGETEERKDGEESGREGGRTCKEQKAKKTAETRDEEMESQTEGLNREEGQGQGEKEKSWEQEVTAQGDAARASCIMNQSTKRFDVAGRRRGEIEEKVVQQHSRKERLERVQMVSATDEKEWEEERIVGKRIRDVDCGDEDGRDALLVHPHLQPPPQKFVSQRHDKKEEEQLSVRTETQEGVDEEEASNSTISSTTDTSNVSRGGARSCQRRSSGEAVFAAFAAVAAQEEDRRWEEEEKEEEEEEEEEEERSRRYDCKAVRPPPVLITDSEVAALRQVCRMCACVRAFVGM